MDKPQIAFVLALVGGIFSLASSVMMGLFVAVFLGLGIGVTEFPMFPAMLIGGFFAWLFVLGVIGGIVMLVACPKLKRPGELRSGAIWALVGGILAVVGGNMIAGGLGIGAGAIILLEG